MLKVAEANAAIDSLKANAAGANKEIADSDKAASDAEKLKSDAFSKSALDAIKAAQSTDLYNRAVNQGFNTPQDAKNFRDSQETPSWQRLYQAKTGGRLTADQALQDMKNQTQARLQDNTALASTKKTVDDLATSYEDTAKAASDLDKGITDAAAALDKSKLSATDLKSSLTDSASGASLLDTALSTVASSGLSNLNEAAQKSTLGTDALSAALADSKTSSELMNAALEDSSLGMETAKDKSDALSSSLDETKSSASDFSKGITDAANSAASSSSPLKGVSDDLSKVANSADDATNSLTASQQAFKDYQEAQKVANARAEAPVSSMVGERPPRPAVASDKYASQAEQDAAAALRAQAEANAAKLTQEGGMLSAEAKAASAARAAQNVSPEMSTAPGAFTGASRDAEDLANTLQGVKKDTEDVGTAADVLPPAFRASTAAGADLATQMDKVDTKISQLEKSIGSGFSDQLLTQFSTIQKNYKAIQSSAEGLDNPAARAWITDTGPELDSLGTRLQEMKAGMSNAGDEFLKFGDDAEKTGTNTLNFQTKLEDLRSKLVDWASAVQRGDVDLGSLSSSMLKTAPQLKQLATAATALDDPQAVSAVNELRARFDTLSSSVIKSADDLDKYNKSQTVVSELAESSAKQSLSDLQKGYDDVATAVSKGTMTTDEAKSSLDKLAASAGEVTGASDKTVSGIDSVLGQMAKFSTILDDNRTKIDANVASLSNLKTLDTVFANTALTGIQKAMNDLNTSIAKGTVNSDQAITKNQSLVNSLLSLKKTYPDLTSTIDAMIAKLTASTVAINADSDALDKLNVKQLAAKKAADDTTASWQNLWGMGKNLKSGLDDLAADFMRLSAAASSEGGSGGGIGGILGSLGGAANAGVSGILGSLGSLVSFIAPLMVFATLIPTIASAIVGLGAAIGGLIGALSPLVGVFATFLPVVVGMIEALKALQLSIGPIEAAFKDLTGTLGFVSGQAQTQFESFSTPIQQVAKDLKAFQSAFDDISKVVPQMATNLASGIAGPLGGLKDIVPPITTALVNMSKAIGQALQPILQGFISFMKSSEFTTISEAAANGLVSFGHTVTNLLTVLGTVATAAAPYTVIIAKWFDTFTQGMVNVSNATAKNGGFKDFFNQMMIALAEVGNIARGVARIFDNWGSGLAPIGNFILTGIGKGLNTIADDANKVNFKVWVTDTETFLSGLGKIAKALVDLFGALVKPEFLKFLGNILTDVASIAEGLKPVLKTLTDIVAGALPTMSKIFHDISQIALDVVIHPLDTFFRWLDSNKDLMAGLSSLFGVMATVVVSASLLSLVGKLSDLASAKWSGLVDMLNKLPGVNLPGGGVADTSTAGKMQTAADTMLDAANKQLTAATGQGTAADKEGVAADKNALDGGKFTIGDAAAGIIATALGAALVAYLVTGVTNPKSALRQEQDKLNSPGTPSVPATPYIPAQGRPGQKGYVPAQQAQPGSPGTPGGPTSDSSELGQIAKAVRDVEGIAIKNFFTDDTQWEKASNRAIKDFFTGNQGWQKASNTAVANFFTDKSGWEKAANKAIGDFFTGNAGWEKAANSSISGWFKSVGSWFMRDAYTPVKNWVSRDFVGFFTTTIPNWFRTASASFMRDVYTPVKNWVSRDFVGFFTSTIPHWFESAGGAFTRNVYTPVKNWVSKDFVSFFTSTIPQWFSTAGKWFTQDVYTPVKNWVSKDFVSFFTTTIPSWFSTVGKWFTQQVYTPIKNWVSNDFVSFFTTTIPKWFSTVESWFTQQVYTPIKNWITNDFVSFFTTTIPKWFSTVGGFFTNDVYNPIKDFIMNTIPSFFSQTIPHWFDSVSGFFTSKVIQPISTFLSGLGSSIEGAFKGAINSVITGVINPVIHFIDDVIGVIPGAPHINDVSKLAAGGHVQGNLGETDTSDSTLARLTPGEFVIRKKAAQALGSDMLHWLNHADKNLISSGDSNQTFLGVMTQQRLTGGAGGSPKFASGGGVPGLAGGGPITNPTSPTGNGPVTNPGGSVPTPGQLTKQQQSNPNQSTTTGLGAAESFIKGLVLGAMKGAFDAGWNTFASPAVNTLSDPKSVPESVLKTGALGFKAAIDSFLTAQDKKYNDIGGVIPSGSQKGIIDAALQAAGVPTSSWGVWEAGLNTLIQRESGWNASAVNNSDSNAAAGTPSEGLAQVIKPTFEAYRVSSLPDDLLNPIANVAAAIRYIEATYGCVPLDTMILTKRGWLTYDKVQVGDETVGYNFETGNNEWTKITQVHFYEDAPLVKLSNSQLEVKCTPNHRWIVDHEYKGDSHDLKCDICDKDNFKTLKGVGLHRNRVHGLISSKKIHHTRQKMMTVDIGPRDYLVVSSPHRTVEGLDITTAEAELLGWITGDGTVRRSDPKSKTNFNKRCTLYQAKPEHVKRLRSMMEEGNIPFKEHVYLPRKNGYLERHEFTFSTKYINDLLRRSGYKHNEDTINFVLSMSSEQRSAWLHGVIEAEGYKVKSKTGKRGTDVYSIVQTDGEVQDGIALAVYLEGYQPRRNTLNAGTDGRKPSGTIPSGTIHQAVPRISKSYLAVEEIVSEDVWCVSTELGS